MFLIQSQMDLDSSLVVASEPPYIDDDGDRVDAKLVVYPFGKRTRTKLSDLRIVMDEDEADDLSRQILQVLAAMRAGRYTERG